MAMYATADDLASFLQKDLDTSTATLVLTLASGEFSRLADTWWSPQTVTYTTPVEYNGLGILRHSIVLPFYPVTAVSEVRINGVVVTGWTLILSTLYRPAGFGGLTWYLPDKVEVDLTHGYTTVPDDVKAAVLDTAGQAYEIPPNAVQSESIDDYAVRYVAKPGGLQLTPFASELAASYRGATVA